MPLPTAAPARANDQVRFELTIKGLAPNMQIIAPWRTWEMKSREDEIAYAEAHDIPLKISRETNYSKDKNLVASVPRGAGAGGPCQRAQLGQQLPGDGRAAPGCTGRAHLCEDRL